MKAISNQMTDLIAKIVAMADHNRALMDGTTEPVKQIMASADIVYGVWQDNTQPDGFDWRVVKGQNTLAAIMQSGTTRNVQMNPVPCINAEQAMALQLVLGDGDRPGDVELEVGDNILDGMHRNRWLHSSTPSSICGLTRRMCRASARRQSSACSPSSPSTLAMM